jgi:hypothetical protein
MESAVALGVRTFPLKPRIDNRYCNKLGQLPQLQQLPADYYALCDTDLAFLHNLNECPLPVWVGAKVVDYQRPTLWKLQALISESRIMSKPRIVQTTCDNRPTFSTNCNGGLYIVKASAAPLLTDVWNVFAELAYRSGHILGGGVRHADQIGFCLAMLSLGWDVDHIPVEWNFPMHVANSFQRFEFERPKVLHHHNRLSRSGLLLETGHKVVDESIRAVNAKLARWQANIRLPGEQSNGD